MLEGGGGGDMMYVRGGGGMMHVRGGGSYDVC